MKQLLFWVLFIPLTVVNLIMDTSVTVGLYWFAFGEVYDVLVRRFEYWCFDVKRGVDMNCPFKKTLKQVWDETLEY